jgi:hypothetical protein
MSNALTISALAENIFRARDQVARELIGFIPAVMLNTDAKGVSTGGTVTSFRTAVPTLGTTLTPAMSMPDGDDQTLGADTMTISQAAVVKIPLKGEIITQLANTIGYENARQQLIAQGIRAMVNAIESHVATVLKNGSSRAWGTAGTTPFGTPKLADAANMQKILDDNGVPADGRTLVINTSAAVALGTLTQLTNVGDAGTADLLRRGILGDLFGFSLRKSTKVASHTKGTGAAYAVDLVAGYSVGGTAIHIDTGTGTILAGDVLAFESDDYRYVVNTGCAGDADQDIVIAQPGLLAALANNKTVTVGNSYVANMAFHRDACELAIRPPALPPEGDAGSHMIVADDKSPLVFDAAIYPGYLMNVLHLSCVYQAKVWKPEYVATLMG